MRTLHAALLTWLAASAGLLSAGTAAAQADVNPPLPNVMLLVDNSGSMEYTSTGDATYPVCDPSAPSASNGRSRWIELVEVLTGTIQDYRCQAVDRSGSAFTSEYSLNSVKPYDYNYKVPYHRPISGTCTPGPGALSTNAYEFPANAIRYHEYGNSGIACTNFEQSSDGLLDTFLPQIRFGLMTFDPLPDPGTGVDGTNAPNYSAGINGMWSYFVGNHAQGKPANCIALRDYEVGARNSGAPPWEGRMVSFGPDAMNQSALTTKNSQIQQILLATRPYGATPINGMLDDVRAFWFEDDRKDPLDTTKPFGPRDDAYAKCRKKAVLLLSDGEPNTDMRPFCEEKGELADGVCPYPEEPHEIAKSLHDQGVNVAVVGFALSSIQVGSETVDCSAMADESVRESLCTQYAGNKAVQACCTLNKIAAEGGTQVAQFAKNKTELRKALGAVLSDLASNTTSRTYPVTATATSVQSDLGVGYRFFSSFEPRQFELWRGVIERQRYKCVVENGQRVPKPYSSRTEGDKFADNVNSGAGPNRYFYTVNPALAPDNERYPERSIRPRVTNNADGVGAYGGTIAEGEATQFISNTLPESMALEANSGVCEGKDEASCRTYYLRWLLGLSNPGSTETRCESPGDDCNLIGGVYHSTPRVVGPPSEILRDETYEQFAAAQLNRPHMLYTSTIDGLFHAFKVGANDPTDTFKVNKLENNELWAFIPPAVLPRLPGQYPSNHSLLLDGAPVIKDVVATQIGTSELYSYERTLSGAREGKSSWRTVMVQAFGGLRGGYFALDVTEPVRKDGAGGPQFLWQLTTDDKGNALFGNSGVTPLITTLFFKDGDQNKEVAVAVLPGGSGSKSNAEANRSGNDDLQGNGSPRSSVNGYDEVGGRSLTIVRLDNGEILRTFRREKTELPAAMQDRVNVANLDSPIVGEPVAYPGAAGAVADRIFVGDQDGALWRVDVSDVDPSKWTMRLFYDAYTGKAWDAGQPIVTPPVLSSDLAGNITVAFSTGDQEVLTGDASVQNFVVSLTENADGTSKLNWYKQLDRSGERVTGPMTLFNEVLYFASFAPADPNVDACATGTSRLWAMNYARPQTTSQLRDGGRGSLPDVLSQRSDDSATPKQYIDAGNIVQNNSTQVTIFGVTVAQLPTCVDEVDELDSFMGNGSMHYRQRDITPGKFQLVMQTGAGGGSDSELKTKVEAVDLESPLATPRFDSWAAIIE